MKTKMKIRMCCSSYADSLKTIGEVESIDELRKYLSKNNTNNKSIAFSEQHNDNNIDDLKWAGSFIVLASPGDGKYEPVAYSNSDLPDDWLDD